MPPFDIQFDKYILAGIDLASQQTAATVANTLGSFGLIAPLNAQGLVSLAAFHLGGNLLDAWAQRRVKAFQIDFSAFSPTWWTTDDLYWADILNFFGL